MTIVGLDGNKKLAATEIFDSELGKTQAEINAEAVTKKYVDDAIAAAINNITVADNIGY